MRAAFVLLLLFLPATAGARTIAIDVPAGAQVIAGLSLAVRLPRAEKPTWLITGYQVDRLAYLASLVLLKEAGARIWGRGDEPFDYLLRETAWLERSGVWRATDSGFGVDRTAERDDFAARLNQAKPG